MSNKLNYSLVSFHWQLGEEKGYGDRAIGVDGAFNYKTLTNFKDQLRKDLLSNSGLPLDSQLAIVVLSISYLGEFTEEEFGA